MTLHSTRDDRQNPIPVFRRRDTLAHNVTVAANNHQRVAFDDKTKLISFWSEGIVFVKFGDDTVTATANDHAIAPGNIEYEPLIDEQGKAAITHMSFFSTSEVVVHVSERH